ncbi:MAG: glycosyltransferase [Candidatus Methanomethylophilaceae archaeon]|jgi:glycosyltransferase involved in cell wall biosynthesis
MIPVTIGICAYNESENIERAIRSVYDQKLSDVDIEQVIVISSGSTDGTDKIVIDLMKEFHTLILIPQEKREGKNSAVNLLLDKKTTNIVVLLNADNAFNDENTLGNLLRPLSDPKVGIVGGHPIPTNSKKEFVGFATHMLWTMHHHISLIYPKIGELVAFRDIGTRLPLGTQSDEDILRMKLEAQGFKSVYAADAVILNRGPETVSDFIKQRTRVNIGERYMKRNYDYDIPTWDKKFLMNALINVAKDLGFHPFKMIFAVTLELISRSRAMSHVSTDDGDINIWDPVETTKRL